MVAVGDAKAEEVGQPAPHPARRLRASDAEGDAIKIWNFDAAIVVDLKPVPCRVREKFEQFLQVQRWKVNVSCSVVVSDGQAVDESTIE